MATTHRTRYGSPDRKAWVELSHRKTFKLGVYLAFEVIVEDILHVVGELGEQDVVAVVLRHVRHSNGPHRYRPV